MSNFYVGTQKPKSIYVGTSKVKALYLGTEKVWEVSGGGLPSEYQEVEWIQSSGTQYIVTNYYPTSEVTYELRFQKTTTSGDACIIACKDNGGQSFNVFPYSIQSLYVRPGQKLYIDFSSTDITLKFEPPKVYVDDVEKLGNQAKPLNQAFPLHIFSYDNGAYKIGAKLWKATFKDNGELSADFVPCYHKTSGDIGMYDLVGRQFYTNVGSGTFTKGADV